MTQMTRINKQISAAEAAIGSDFTDGYAQLYRGFSRSNQNKIRVIVKTMRSQKIRVISEICGKKRVENLNNW